ncbi:MAG: hypothetical protein IPH23_14640 [Gammaproteobacteria bacterium]|nr:hypothetical protein [Gammaproteobacteria bacterium]
MVDALGMALGDRGDTDRIRTGAERCEVAARFEVTGNAAVRDWLHSRYPVEDECLLRRIFTRDAGRGAISTARPPPCSSCRRSVSRSITTASTSINRSCGAATPTANCSTTMAITAPLLPPWANPAAPGGAERPPAPAGERPRRLAARRNCWRFGGGTRRLTPATGELAALEREQKLLANAGQVLDDCHALLALGGGDNDGSDVRATLYRAQQLALSLVAVGAEVASCAELFDSARIQVDEALREIEVFATGVEVDPARLQAVDDRLDSYYRLARKHGVQSDTLTELHQRLTVALAEAGGDDEDLAALRKALARHETAYRNAAAALTQARKKTAASFSTAAMRRSPRSAGGRPLRRGLQARRDDAPNPLGAGGSNS